MGYQHITNLYKDQRVLCFKEVYALEKVHGTSAHLTFSQGELNFFSGGMKGTLFTSIFNCDELIERFKFLGYGTEHADPIKIYGEAYGGKEQGMSGTYGKAPQFVAFEVNIGGTWLDVPRAANVVDKIGLKFIPYEFGPTTMEWLNSQRDRDSIVAQWHGMGPGHKREGIVIRPPFEVRLNNDERLMVKHKRDDFRETKSSRSMDPDQLKILEDATAIADEWVVPMRLEHVLQKIPGPHDVSNTPRVVSNMIEDVLRESEGEIVDSKAARRAIGNKAAQLFKTYLKSIQS
jgi:RNA ligase